MSKLDNAKKIEFILYGGKETEFWKEGDAAAPVYKEIYDFYTLLEDRCFYISPVRSCENARQTVFQTGGVHQIDWMGQKEELNANIRNLVAEIRSWNEYYKGEEKKKFLEFFENFLNFLSTLKRENKKLHLSLKKKQSELYDEFYRIF